MYTYNRTDDARINMEIIRNIWKKVDLLKNVTIIHAFNGEKDWWPEKYLEDELLYLDNPGHFGGAEILLNEGMKCFREKYPEIDYVITLASDTWFIKPEFLENIIKTMEKDNKYLAASVWGTKKRSNIWKRGGSMDFNIIDHKWSIQSSLFPIGYKEFVDKFDELFFYNDHTIYLEIVFMTRFIQAISRSVKISSDNLLKPIAEKHIYRISEREPVHKDYRENILFKRDGFSRRMYWSKIGLLTHHEPEPKRKILKSKKLRIGKYTNQLIDSRDLSYFNQGVRDHTSSTSLKKGGDAN